LPRAGSGHVNDPLNFDIVGLLVRPPTRERSASPDHQPIM
jgi:hypothetical protein